MTENAFINVKNRSHTITAEVEIPEGGGEGVDPRPGWPLRWLEPLYERQQGFLRPQLGR